MSQDLSVFLENIFSANENFINLREVFGESCDDEFINDVESKLDTLDMLCKTIFSSLTAPSTSFISGLKKLKENIEKRNITIEGLSQNIDNIIVTSSAVVLEINCKRPCF